jgi:predicted NACHT family NTPase
LSAAAHLRHAARQRRRILLLLDGWDEVPANLRNEVRPRLLTECEDFVTVITSRPSGVPHALREARSGQVYELAGLSPRALEDLARRQFERAGRPDRLPVLLRRLAEQPDLRDMCGNPFLLTLVCRVAAAAPPGSDDLLPRTRAEVYDRAVDWMRVQYNQVRQLRPELFPEQLSALDSLSGGAP